jgi:hypothetical protein
MEKLLDILSTRELALLIWVAVIIIAMTFGKGMRQSLFGILKAFFAKQIATIFTLLTIYVLAAILLLQYLSL